MLAKDIDISIAVTEINLVFDKPPGWCTNPKFQ
jgi:hypothetical protein